MQRRVRFVDDAAPGASQSSPPRDDIDRQQLTSILDALLAEHALQRHQPQQQQTPLEIAINMSQSEEIAEPRHDGGSDSSPPSQPAHRARTATPPSPVPLDTEGADSSVTAPHAAWPSLAVSASPHEPHQSRIDGSSSPAPLPLSAAPVLLVASPLPSLSSSITGGRTQDGALLRPLTPQRETAPMTEAQATWRVQAAENVQRLLRSSEQQVAELLALRPALVASKKVSRDLEAQLRTVQEELTSTRLLLLQAQTTTHDATSTLSQENLAMQSAMQQLEREKAQLTLALSKAREVAAQEANTQRDALEAARHRAQEDKKALEEARRERSDVAQLRRERDHWQRACTTTAQELAQAHSENARLEAKLFEQQRRRATLPLSAPSSAGAHGDDSHERAEIDAVGASSTEWQEEHVQFLRREIARLEALVQQQQGELDAAAMHAAQSHAALAEMTAEREAAAQRVWTLEAALDDARHQQCIAEQTADVMSERVREAAAAAHTSQTTAQAQWVQFATNVFDACAAAASATPALDEAFQAHAAAVQAVLEIFADVDPSDAASPFSSSPQQLAAALDRMLRAMLLASSHSHQRALAALAEAQQSHARRDQQAAETLRRAHAREAQALQALSAKYTTLLRNALREYGESEVVGGRRGPHLSSSDTRVAAGEISAVTEHDVDSSMHNEDNEGNDDVDARTRMSPPSTVGAPSLTDDGADSAARKNLASEDGSSSFDAGPALPRWQHHYQQLLRVLAGVRHTTTTLKTRLNSDRAELAALRQRVVVAESHSATASKSAQDAQAKHAKALAKQAAQLAATAAQADTRAQALKADVETALAEAETAKRTCEVLRKHGQALSQRTAELQDALDTATTHSAATEAEVQSLTELLDAAKTELVSQRAAATEHARTHTELRAAARRWQRDVERVYALLRSWVRFAVCLLLRVDRLGASHGLWRYLAQTGHTNRTDTNNAVDQDDAQTRAHASDSIAALHELLRHVTLAQEKSAQTGEEDVEGGQNDGRSAQAPLRLLVLPDATTMSALSRASLHRAPPSSSTQPARPHCTSLRAVVVAIMAARRLAWLVQWHSGLDSSNEENNDDVDDDTDARAGSPVPLRGSHRDWFEGRGRAYSRPSVSSVLSRGPRVVFFEEEASAGRRTASPVRPLREDEGEARTRAVNSGGGAPLFSFLSARVVRQMVLGLRGVVLPELDLPPLSELLTALERFHVAEDNDDDAADEGDEAPHEVSRSSHRSAGTPQTSRGMQGRRRRHAAVPDHALVEYLLHRVHVRANTRVNAYCAWSHGLHPGGAHTFDRLRVASTRMPAPAAAAAIASSSSATRTGDVAALTAVATMEAVRDRVWALLCSAAQTQQVLLRREAAALHDLQDVLAQNAQLGHALQSRESAYDGIEASVVELERLLRQRPAPEELTELRAQLVAAQQALEKERQAKRVVQAQLAEQTEKELRLMQAMQQLRNQNRVLHIEASRRGVDPSDLDRLQMALFRQPPPPSAPPSRLPSSSAASVTMTPSQIFADSISAAPARPQRGFSGGDNGVGAFNWSNGGPPSTVPGCSSEDEAPDHDRHEARRTFYNSEHLNESDDPLPRRDQPQSWGPQTTTTVAAASTTRSTTDSTALPHAPPPAATFVPACQRVAPWPHSLDDAQGTDSMLPPRTRLTVSGQALDARLVSTSEEGLPGGARFGIGAENHSLSLYTPVTVDLARMPAAQISRTTPGSVRSAGPEDASPIPRVQMSGAGGNRRAPPVLDLQARF